MSTTSTYPENGLGLILYYQELQTLLDNINHAEDLQLMDAYDLNDCCIGIKNKIIPLIDMVWTRLRNINGQPIAIDEDAIYGGCIFVTEKQPLPLQTAYNDVSEIAKEMQESIGAYLSKDFDYTSHIVLYEFVFCD